MGASWAVVDAVRTEEANTLKMYVFRKEWGYFCPFGDPLGGLLGRLEGLCGRLEAVLGSLGPLLGRLEALGVRYSAIVEVS